MSAIATTASSPPVVLCIAGFDPSGGAGLQADIETVIALGGRAVCAMTCNTIQDGDGVRAVASCDTDFLRAQIALLVGSFQISAVKIGLLPSVDTVRAVAGALKTVSAPVVTDPVWVAGSGDHLNDTSVLKEIRRLLLPVSAVTTPNLREILALVPDAGNYHEAARALRDEGCGCVLVTGAQKKGDRLEHLIVTHEGEQILACDILQHRYHGSGCTLSAAIAVALAQKMSLSDALHRAQDFTRNALVHAGYPGHGQHFPYRK